MKLARSIAAHSILALGGLTLAYLVWTDDGPDVSPSAVTILECDPDVLSRIELEQEDKDVTLELRAEDDARVAWITVESRPESGEATTERFVGSEAVETWLAEIAPLRASRSLGALEGEQLEELGLAEPEGTLTITCGEPVTFALGASAYGSGDRYVQREGGGPVYLVARDRIAPLAAAEHRLMERSLHTFELREVVSLRLRAFDREKELLQHNRLDAQRAEWVDAAAPDRRDETFGNWLSRFPRLRVQEYLEPDARPGADLEGVSVAPEPVMRMDYVGEDAELGFVEIARVVHGAELAYYARSETTRSWVRVPTSIGQQIEEDLRAMLGVAPLERPEPVAPDAGASAPDAGVAAPDAGQ